MYKTAYALLFGAAAIVAGPVVAQTSVFANDDAIDDRIDDLDDDIEDDAERDIDAFGNTGRPIGFTGSFALRGTATDGNTDTVDLGIGARLGYYDGKNGHKLSLSYDYSEDDDDVSDNSLLLGYDYTRDLTPRLYGFGKILAVYDEFDSFKEDYFVGVGLGYRLVTTSTIDWSVQAGPGWRATVDDNGNYDEDAAYTVSSYYAHQLAENLYLTNDTTLIGADGNSYVTNDLALSVSVNDSLSLRTGLLTEYNSDPLPGFDETDNKLAVSLVYQFN